MSVINRQIHRNEFKLRLLLTNQCNLNCPFCLNDFQPKGNDFMDLGTAQRAIRAYHKVVGGAEGKHYPPQIYISGGEPSLNPEFVEIVAFARAMGCELTVNTNGYFANVGLEWAAAQADNLHVGVYKIDPVLAEKIKRRNGKVQCVYSSRYPYVDREFLDFYLKEWKLPVKIFADFFDQPGVYEGFCHDIASEYEGFPLSFRHTGVQENRGVGCEDCEKRCITLKAAWVMPDGGVSWCPQLMQPLVYPKTNLEWERALVHAEIAHRV